MSSHFLMGTHGLGQSLNHVLEDGETHMHPGKPRIGMSAILQDVVVDVEAAFLVNAGDGNETQKMFPSNSLHIKSDSKQTSLRFQTRYQFFAQINNQNTNKNVIFEVH